MNLKKTFETYDVIIKNIELFVAHVMKNTDCLFSNKNLIVSGGRVSSDCHRCEDLEYPRGGFYGNALQ